MIVNSENINTMPISDRDKQLLKALLIDVDEINNMVKDRGFENKQLYIEWQDYHDEYSPERVDPCPDFYGYYRLRFNDSTDAIGVNMTINDLDINLCTLIEFLENFHN